MRLSLSFYASPFKWNPKQREVELFRQSKQDRQKISQLDSFQLQINRKTIFKRFHSNQMYCEHAPLSFPDGEHRVSILVDLRELYVPKKSGHWKRRELSPSVNRTTLTVDLSASSISSLEGSSATLDFQGTLAIHDTIPVFNSCAAWSFSKSFAALLELAPVMRQAFAPSLSQ